MSTPDSRASERFRAWILNQLEVSKAQKGLVAAAMRMSPTSFSRVFSGERQVSAVEFAAALDFFDNPLSGREVLTEALGGLGDGPTSPSLVAALQALDAPKREISNSSGYEPKSLNTGQMIPVYGQAIGGEDGNFILNGNKMADVLAPPLLRGAHDAYGVFVVGESMEPRYFAGEIVYVNPHLPVRRGDFVVVQVHYEEDRPPHGFVKRFVRMQSHTLVVEQFNPPKELSFPRDLVASVHRIVMSGEG